MKSLMKRIFLINIFLFFSFDSFQCKFLENKALTREEEGKIIATITTDDESALRQATFYLWKLGGIIYIDTPVINFKTEGSISITGTIEGGIIGKKQQNGEYPRLNFKEQRDSTTTFYQSGINVVGSNKVIKNLIVENAGTFGIFVSGQKNTIDHVITRYNGQSGIFVSSDSDSNTFNYIYSYRNFHFDENNLIADGFTVEIGGINNIFNNCFAWENSQNGFGYYHFNGLHKNGALTYTHSASWNNGNIDVFSGKYDFDNGKDLDKNMWTIQQIIKSDENFENNYNNKIFNLEDVIINTKPANDYFSEYSKEDEGNGFNLGNERNEPSLINRRTVDYCVSFDHKSKGFNSNKSQNFTGLFSNSVSFNNNMNYDLPYSFVKWNNNWGWNSNEDDHFDLEVIVRKPSNMASAKKDFYSIRDQIIKAVYDNRIPEDINFDKVIKGLSE